MPKKISEIEKKKLIDNFIHGITIDELSKKYNCTQNTIIRHLKKGVDEKIFKEKIKKSNKKDEIKFNIKNDFKNEETKKETFEEQSEDNSIFSDPSFFEIAPLNFEIDNESQKDLASISIAKIELPKVVYMIVDNRIELETKTLRDYPDWQFLSQEELNKGTIEIYFDIKIAKRFCSKEQKVIKVPNTNVFRIVAPLLVSRGISRIVCPDKLISL